MALSTGPLDKSQHCPQHPTRGDINLVLPGWHLQRMDINSFSLVDPWETYVLLSVDYPTLLDFCFHSRLRQERPLVRGSSAYSSSLN
jgi:hypothetical protein